jgi:hypothetical protein
LVAKEERRVPYTQLSPSSELMRVLLPAPVLPTTTTDIPGSSNSRVIEAYAEKEKE